MTTFRKLIAATAVAALSTAAMAADVTIQSYKTLGESDGGFVTATGTPYGTAGGTALEFDITPTAGNSFAAYCLEVNAPFGGAGNTYNVSIQTKDAIARLFAVAGFNGSSFATDAVDTATEASGLQLAIWEVVSDGLVTAIPNFYTAGQVVNAATGGVDGLDGTGNWMIAGNSRAWQFSVEAAAQATTFLNAAAGLAEGSYLSNVAILTNLDDSPHRQNLVTSVPEPSTYALMAACLGVMGLVARRKQA